MAKLLESDDYILSNVVLLFLLINFNLEIGTIYIAMAIIDWLSYYIFVKNVSTAQIPLERNANDRLTKIAWAIGAYIAFVFITGLIVTKVSSLNSSMSSFEYLSSLVSQTFSATPILYGSTYLKLAVWGILIPIVETRFFFRTAFMWATVRTTFKMPTNIMSISAFGYAAFFGILFAVFHIVAKGITDNNALMVTGLFGFLSIMVIIFFRESVTAIYLHIINNTIGTMALLKLGFFEAGGVNYLSGAVIMSIVLFVSYILLFIEIPFVGFIKARA
jgi:hypothetical protein